MQKPRLVAALVVSLVQLHGPWAGAHREPALSDHAEGARKHEGGGRGPFDATAPHALQVGGWRSGREIAPASSDWLGAVPPARLQAGQPGSAVTGAAAAKALPSPTTGSARQRSLAGVVFSIAAALGLVLAAANLLRLRRRRRARPPLGPVRLYTHSGDQLYVRTARLHGVGDRWIALEHAMRFGEDEELRALLDEGTAAEQKARLAVSRAYRGELDLPAVDALLEGTERLASKAEKRVRRLYGPAALRGAAERVGCWFCARPLANADYRRPVSLCRGKEAAIILACPACAEQVERGEPPEVRIIHNGGRMLHWSELPGYDPYTHRHRDLPGVVTIPSGCLEAERPLAYLAAAAAGEACGTLKGLAHAEGGPVRFDLDAARESVQAGAAAVGAGLRAVRGKRRSERP